ncbi:MAG TPA: APC family permease [Pyrinomonadaceae bacterium]|nr:APC family permease [Pyrinomonadaceae bacterium]
MEPIQATVKLQAAGKERLLRIFGVGFGIAGAIGATIGAGILRTPGLVAAQLGDANLIIAAWILGGVYAMLGAISIAELGASLPRAGGWYVYARRAFGLYAGFATGWMDWLGNCASLAWVAITIGEYSLALAPNLGTSAKTIGVAVILLFSLLHLLGARIGGDSQKLLSLAKALAFLALVAACFIFGGKTTAGATQTALHLPPTPAALAIALVFALQAIITTYDGWYGSIYFAEEFQDPPRDIPRSLFGSVLSIICIYVLVNLALLYVLPLPQIAASNLPVADAAQAVFGAYSGQLITALALLSLLGLINAVTMGGPRILFGLSRDRLFSSVGARVNRGGTPVVALFLTTLAAVILVISGTFERLLAMAAFLYVAIYITGFAALFVLRKREPELPRPFKAWGYPWTTLIVLAGSILFLVGAIVSDTANSIYAVLLIALSYPVYLLVKRFGDDRA